MTAKRLILRSVDLLVENTAPLADPSHPTNGTPSMRVSGAQPEEVEDPDKTKPVPRTINGAVLDVRSAAALVGGSGGSEKQVRALVARRRIPFRRLGGRIVFIRSELLAWLSALEGGCSLEEALKNMAARRE